MKKNIWKRLVSLALALVMVAGWLPHMAPEAYAAAPIKLEGTTYAYEPGQGFKIWLNCACSECIENFNSFTNYDTHKYEITSYSYSISGGNYSISVSGNFTGCKGTAAFSRELSGTFSCTDELYKSSSSGAIYAGSTRVGTIGLKISRDASTHNGNATCKTADTCALCAKSFTNASNHEKPDEFTYSVNASDSAKHDKKYACCGATKETVAHTVEPTYTVNATDHTKHDITYSCCEGIAETTGHSNTYSVTNGNVIAETCTNGCGHQAIADIVAGEAIYTGSEITNTVTISYTSGTWAGAAPVLSYENNVDVGTATAKMTAGDATVSTTFKINPANLSYATVALNPESGTYTGSDHNRPTYTLTYNGKPLAQNIDYIVEGGWTGDFLNAGDNTLMLTGKGNFTGTKTLTYTIGKATPAFTAPAAKELTFNGEPLALVEAGSVNPGKLLYRLGDGEYSETVPTATNAGDYTVYYTVEGLDTSNYNEIPSGSVSVTIGKASAPAITFPEVLNTITYGQKLEEAKLSSYTNDYGTFSWNAPTSVPNAGTAGYALDFYPNELALQNYDWKDAGEAQWFPDRNALCICPNVTVNQAAATITTDPTPNNLTYNGEDQTLITAGSVTGGTMVYSLEMEGEYKAELPQAMDVGTYYVWYKVEADSNHTASAAPASVTVEIKKANASVDATPSAISGLVYNGKEQTLVNPVESMGGTVYYSLDGVNYTTSVPNGINAQEYTVYYKVVGDANHNDMEPRTVTAKIAPVNIETASCKAGVLGGPFTYNGQEHIPAAQLDVLVPSGEANVPGAEVRLTEGTDYTVTYSHNVNAGQAVVTFTGKGNYTGTITREFTIAPKPITVTIADKTSVYGEAVAELTATTDGIVNNDTDVYSLATTATSTANVGTYPITGTVLDANYDIIFENGTYTVTKAPVNSIGTDKTVTYTAGMEVDLRQMFSIDENAGAVDYWITHLTGEGSFTSAPYLYRIDKVGTFTVKITTEETANYNSGEATAVLTVNPGDPGIGAVTAGVVSNTLETSAIVLTRANTDIDGNLTVDAEQTLAWGDNTIRYTFTPTDGTNYKVVKGEVTVTVVDTIAPTGTVTVSTKSWAEFLNNITFGLFFKETQNVSVTAEDNLSGVAKIEYIESKTALDLDAVKAATQWTEMKNGSVSVTLEDTKQFIYYIRITDKSGNIAYLSSDGAEYDTAAPVIVGVDNGVIYYTTQNVTVTDKNIDTITLNGEAATSSISLAGNKEATYTIVATDKAGNSTTVTVTMKPIKELAKATENLGNDNVTSADAPVLKALVEKLDELIADPDTSDDGERETLEQHKAIAESLIQTIEDTAAEQKAVTDKAAEYDDDAVKSTDKAGLEALAEDIEALLDIDNLTQDERADLEALLEDVEDMIDTINTTAADSKTATDAIDALDSESVKSTDKAAIEKALETVENLLDGDHLIEDERKALEDAKTDAEALLDAIEDAAKAVDTENTAKVEDVTADNVTPEDKSNLEDAKADLEKALEDNGGNYTEEEKQAIENEIQRIEDALEIIENVEAAEDAISDLPATVEPDDEETVVKIEEAKKIYDELTDYEKSLVDEKVKEKLDKLTAASVAYEIVKGDGGKWSKDTTSGLSFTANGPISKFVSVEIDGKVIDAKHYSAKAGSTIITLNASYLETLSVGTHTITVVYSDGETEGTFKINPKSATPATGDNFNILLWTSVMIISLAAIAVLLIEQKKRRYVK